MNDRSRSLSLIFEIMKYDLDFLCKNLVGNFEKHKNNHKTYQKWIVTHLGQRALGWKKVSEVCVMEEKGG